MTDLQLGRSFAVLAPIEHGKSTLADRLIESCGGLDRRLVAEMRLFDVYEGAALEKAMGGSSRR